MQVFSYIVDHDMGFAPNPFHGICTLAACKPLIRKAAKEGDLIVGTGSKPNNLVGRLSFWMLVTQVTNFTDYWFAAEFQVKRPVINGSLMQQYGDNIYHREAQSGAWRQADSFHSGVYGELSEKNLVRDTATTEKVLISRKFAYWGGAGPLVPPELSDFVHTTQGHRCRFTAERVAAFTGWLGALARPEFVGRPVNWPAPAG